MFRSYMVQSAKERVSNIVFMFESNLSPYDIFRYAPVRYVAPTCLVFVSKSPRPGLVCFFDNNLMPYRPWTSLWHVFFSKKTRQHRGYWSPSIMICGRGSWCSRKRTSPGRGLFETKTRQAGATWRTGAYLNISYGQRLDSNMKTMLLTRSLADWTIYDRNINYYFSMKIFTYFIEIDSDMFWKFFWGQKNYFIE